MDFFMNILCAKFYFIFYLYVYFYGLLCIQHEVK